MNADEIMAAINLTKKTQQDFLDYFKKNDIAHNIQLMALLELAASQGARFQFSAKELLGFFQNTLVCYYDEP